MDEWREDSQKTRRSKPEQVAGGAAGMDWNGVRVSRERVGARGGVGTASRSNDSLFRRGSESGGNSRASGEVG